MKTIRTAHCSALLAAALSLSVADVSAGAITPIVPAAASDIVVLLPCSGFSTPAGSVKALARSSLFAAHRDFSGGIEDGVAYPAGTFGANPLFSTTVTVGGTANSCLLATLSVNAQPNDNGMVLQARIDGKPMGGQWNPIDFLSLPAGFNVPIVWLPNVVSQPGAFEGIDPPHMAAYTFTAIVSPGVHTLDVRVAGCCHQDIDTPATTPDGYIRSATFAIQHQ